VGAAATLHRSFQSVPGLKLPYFGFDAVPSSFYRVRYLGRLPGFAGAVEKPQRYVQEPDTLNEVYLPPLLDDPWSAIADDAGEELIITEGELKAAACCARGRPCLGLGGVDVWRSAKRGKSLLEQLERFAWKNRHAFIVFDSDAATNVNVVRAQLALADRLTREGADVFIASLPPTPGGAKQGLDDFLLVNDDDALLQLLKRAPEHAEAKALYGLNEEVVYIVKPGFFLDQATHHAMRLGDFTGHAYANRFYDQRVVDAKGNESVRPRPLAKRWVEWPGRYQLRRIVYEPGQPRVTADHEWNGWKGWAVEERQGSTRPWDELLRYMFSTNPDPAALRWFIQWCAYPIQRPGTKMYSSVLLWGATHGTGKTLIPYTLRRIYGDNFEEIKDRQLRGNHNEWARNRQFVLGDEITGADKRAKHDDMEHFKGLITQETITVNEKFVPEYKIRDCINYMWTANQPDTLFLEDTDRRFFVHEAPSVKLPQEFYDAYETWKEDDGPAALLYKLRRVDLTGFNPRAEAPMTPAKAAMIADTKSELGAWIVHLREDPTRALLRLSPERARGEVALLSSAQLLAAYDPEGKTRVTAQAIAKELKRAGFSQVNDAGPVMTSSGLLRLYAVRDAARWRHAKPKAIAAHWDSFFGEKVRKY
jgi:hypothetical protein